MFAYNSREAVRVKVKKCEGKLQAEQRKFSVDPQITSLEVLQSILTKAFDVKSDFSISYKSFDEYGNDVYLPLLSDWDLDAAFLKAHNISVSLKCEPCMQLKVDMKPFAETTEDWEHPGTMNMQSKDDRTNIVMPDRMETRQMLQAGFPSIIMTQVEKTFNMVTRALNLYDDPTLPPRAPLCDAEFRTFLDPVGHIIHSSKLREVIYCGGIDPSLRKVVWKHILNVYPEGMTGKERMDYIKRKAAEYHTLRSCWKDCVQRGQVSGDLAYVTSMVRKDVLRTDRHHTFYAGSDDNQNIASLFNILTTYALNHPLVSYCQGMSDLASPLLVTMGDEAHAYICLCALMSRLHPNFQLDGEAMTLKFTHLTESLQLYDPDFYMYLKSQQADDLLFCYRWLLLEMKREFAFEDALRMLEVLWASLPPKPPVGELPLKDKEFDPNAMSEAGEVAPSSPAMKTPRENAYTKVCAIRRQNSAFSLVNIANNKLSSSKQINYSLDENATRKSRNHISLRHSKEYQSLDDSTLHQIKQNATVDGGSRQKDYTVSVCRIENEHMQLDADSLPSSDSAQENVNEKVSKIHKIKNMNDMRSLSSSTGNLTNGKVPKFQSNDPLTFSNHLEDFRQKLVLNKLFSSLDKLDSNKLSKDNDTEDSKPRGKMIKNLNEFFTITNSNKKQDPPKINRDRLLRTQSVVETSNNQENLSITQSRTSFDEQDVHSAIRAAKDRKDTVGKIDKLTSDLNDNNSSPDDSQEYYPMTTSMTRELRLELEDLDRQVFGVHYNNPFFNNTPSHFTSLPERHGGDCQSVFFKKESKISQLYNTRVEMAGIISATKLSSENPTKKPFQSVDDVYLWENPIHKNMSPSLSQPAVAGFPKTPDEEAELEYDDGEIFEESSGKKSITPIRLLRKVQLKESHNSYLQTHCNVPPTESDVSQIESGGVTRLCTEQDSTNTANARTNVGYFSSMSQELETARKTSEAVLSKQSPNLQSITTTIGNFQKRYDILRPSKVGGEDHCVASASPSSPPRSLGGDNPFLMFLCLSVLLQHRDYIMRNRMDYNELAMHFDKMVRKHNVNRVLNQARQMYSAYLKHAERPTRQQPLASQAQASQAPATSRPVTTHT